MKNIILLLLLVASTTHSYSQKTYIPDDYFETKLIQLGYDSGPLDDSVATSNINQITTLSFEPYMLNDLTGIENFIALKELNCSQNYNLTNLDVSNLLQLERLSCFGCNLLSIDLSNNTKLTHLTIQNNQLIELNLDNNLDLISIDCGSNYLTNLLVSGCSNLLSLKCQYNQLTNLALQLNSNLKFLHCGSNSLNLLSTINNQELITLNCNGNDLNTINVSHLSNLKYLDCSQNELLELNISQLTLLEQLYVSHNNLTNLDVTNLPNLKTVHLSNNDIEILNFSNNSQLEFVMGHDNNLKFVDLRNNHNELLSTSDLNLNNNSNLHCVLVDNASYSNLNWVNSAPQITFSEECYYLDAAEQKDTKVTIYPNPSIEHTNITISQASKFTIHNVNGQSISKGNLIPGTNTLDVSTLESGIYLITIFNQNQTFTKRFSKL